MIVINANYNYLHVINDTETKNNPKKKKNAKQKPYIQFL